MGLVETAALILGIIDVLFITIARIFVPRERMIDVATTGCVLLDIVIIIVVILCSL